MTYRRTVVALALTALAVAGPLAAWFFAGYQQLDREAKLSKKSVHFKAQQTALVLAERLGMRFDLLRKNESQRQFYHYQNLFHDPEAAAEGAFVVPSPLAYGPANPLIAAHFQVDSDGVLTLPTINDEFPELGLQSTDGAHCDVLDRLKGVAFFCLEETVFGTADLDEPRPRAGGGGDDERVRRVSLPRDAWHQHLRANALYAEVKYPKSARGTARALAGAPSGLGKVEVAVWPFTWHTLPIGDGPGLVALRKVETPVGVWTQGFTIDLEAVARQDLAQSYYPVTFAPFAELRSEDRPYQAVQKISGTPWGVALDTTATVEETFATVAAERQRFVRFFLLGSLAAILAALLVVAMVYQSERLALQRTQFAASAAHELRTPLAGLRLYGEMLAEGLGNPERAREYARRMAGEAERLGRVVTNVLSFTRLERESVSIRPRPGDLGEAVRAAFLRQQPALEEAGARVEVELPEDLPQATFDRDAVGHIVQNLLDNAEKYTRGVTDREIRLRLARAAGGLELTVSDNGDGIPEKQRRRLFRPFARGRSNDAEGLGLGLVLIKALANAQGGDVRYRDRPTGGAEFTVTFQT